MARTKDKEKTLAKELYFHTNKTIEEIAEIVNVNRSTLSGWIKANGWATIKEAQKQTPERVVNDMYAELEQMNKAIKSREEGAKYATSGESDSRNKIITGIAKLQNQTGLAQYVQVLTSAMDFIQSKDLDLSKKIVPLLQEFLMDKTEQLTHED